LDLARRSEKPPELYSGGGCAVKNECDLYACDKDNRLQMVTAAGQASTTYGYDAAGNLASVVNPNGLTTTYTYNLLNRLTRMATTSANSAVAAYQYTLGAAGNRTGVAELSGRTVGYGYDDVYRLTSETIVGSAEQSGAISYQYDAVGNRQVMNSTVQAIPPGLWNYDKNDRLTTDVYDNNGNTISEAGIGNTHDFENHLTQHGGVTIVYHGDGNRASETVGGVTTNYLVDTENPTGYAQVMEELQGGVVVRSYTWGHWLISKLETGNSKLSYYGYDGHGSVRFLTDPNGAVTDTYDYDAFGNLTNSTGSTLNNYLFAGEQYDSALGLYYNRARYLDVRTGRFWGMDTNKGDSSAPSTLHKFVYTIDDPVNQRDRNGNQLEELEVAQVVSQRIDTLSILRGIAVLGFIVANFVSTKTEDDDPRYPNRMRVQLQRGLTKTFYGRKAHNTPTIGVTVLQMRQAMEKLFEDARDDTSFGRDQFPFAALQSWLFSAVISLSIKLGRYPPGGILKPERNFIQETTEYRGKEYRLDVDNLSGWNLRQ
jgi:RHS repeat-associated protein